MGAILPKNKDKVTDNQEKPDPGPLILPRKVLKKELLEKLSINKEHHFATYVQYRFWNSYRDHLKKIAEKKLEEEQKLEQERLRNSTGKEKSNSEVVVKKQVEVVDPPEENILVTTWLHDP